MKTTWLAVLVIAAAVLTGCRERLLEPNYTPNPPTALLSLAGDQTVYLSWMPNAEPDIVQYNVYSSASYQGPYHLIGTVTHTTFTDDRVLNGESYYYAVTAVNSGGYESDLSSDVIEATPRPEGYDVVLADYHSVPSLAGYEFSSNSVGSYKDQYTDFFYEVYNGHAYLDVWDDTQIQDAGYTSSLDDVTIAPLTGWSPTHDALAIPGHLYVIKTWDNHYAKVRVISVSSTLVSFDWAYQLQAGNPALTVKTVRNSLTPGTGMQNR